MSKLVLIDGNSIMNRAFYGIMGSKMLKGRKIHKRSIWIFSNLIQNFRRHRTTIYCCCF